MNQQEILKKIGGIIAELKDQYTYLETAGNAFNGLELELFMANANFLTDHIAILKKIQVQNTALPATAPVLSPEKVYSKRPEIPDYFKEEDHSVYTEEIIPVKINVPAVEITEEQSTETPEAIVQQETIFLPATMPQEDLNDQLLLEGNASFTAQKNVLPEPALEEETTFAEPEVIQEIAIEVQPEIHHQPEIQAENTVFMAEKQLEPVSAKPEIEPAVLTLNERIAAQKGLDQPATIASTTNKAVQDLPSLISLNDKLLFVKELFNGYNLAYSEAVNILNRYTTFEQAEHFLNLNYAVKNNWKEKQATAERFYDLLRKRFA